MNILLINLTRLGDLLEMQPVVAGLRQKYADARLGIVCLDNFAPAAALLDGVDSVYPFPGAALLAGIDASWPHACERLHAFCAKLTTEFSPGMVMNLTPTPAARLLGRLAAGKQAALEGFALDSFGFSVNTDPWAAFTQAAGAQRGCSPFNLTDQFRMVAGVGQYRAANRLRAPRGLADSRAALCTHPARTSAAGLRAGPAAEIPATPQATKGFVGLQLGASNDRRRWPVAHFAALADQLGQHGYTPVLLGSSAEAELGQRFAQATATPHINYIGQTSLDGLAAVVGNLSLLATNDTGTMHLAAGLGVPVLAFFLATAQPWDTGPYMENACCLEPDLDCHPCAFGRACPHDARCRTAIKPATAAALALHFLEHGHWPELPPKSPGTQPDEQGGSHMPTAAGSRIWRTLSGSPAGFMDLASLSGHEHADRTRWIRVQREFYRQFLDGDAATTGIVPPDFPALLSAEFSQAAIAELRETSQRLHLLYEQLNLLEQRPSEAGKSRVLATMSRVRALWADSRFFAVLGYIWLSESEEHDQSLGTLKSRISAYRNLLNSWMAYLEA